MKQNKIWTLSALLALQLVAAILLTLDYNRQDQNQAQGPLLALEKSAVDRILIEEPDQPPLELVKQDNRWILPGYYNLAAHSSRIDSLFDSLQALERNWPVATTAASAKRFEVTEEKFQRKLQLQQGDQVLARLYLGSAPAMSKTHVRLDGEDAVYALGLNHHQAPVQASSWVDIGLLQVDRTQLARIQGPDFALVKTEDQWQLDGLGEQEETDNQAVQSLLDGLANLRFQEALGTEAKAEYGLEQPVLTLDLERDGKKVSYHFGKPEAADYYVVKSSELAPYFKVSSYQAEKIVNLKRASLARQKSEEVNGEADDAAEDTAQVSEEEEPAPNA